MSKPTSSDQESLLEADAVAKTTAVQKTSPEKESAQEELPVQRSLLADFGIVIPETRKKTAASTKESKVKPASSAQPMTSPKIKASKKTPVKTAAMATPPVKTHFPKEMTSEKIEIKQEKAENLHTGTTENTTVMPSDADYPTPPEYADLVSATQEEGVGAQNAALASNMPQGQAQQGEEAEDTAQGNSIQESHIQTQDQGNCESHSTNLGQENKEDSIENEKYIEEEIIEGIQEELPPIIDDTKKTVTENSDTSENTEAPEEKSDSAEDAALATADNRPLNQPKGKRPPTKTREERGLPPLDESGNESPIAPEEKPMSLMEHLAELRTRLVRSFIAVGLAFVVSYTFSEQLFAALCQPLIDALPEGSKLIFTALPEAFFVYLQVGLVAAVFVASPYLFYQIWGFVSPGLYEEEKKYMVPMALISAFFFLGGASFCFFVVFPYAFTFFVGFASEDIAAMPSLSAYLGFALKLLIAFGLIFEMPLFTFFLARMGVLTAQIMRNGRKYAILCIFIVAAILTPPDVISQLLMAFPMMLLYELSIGVAAMFGRKKKSDATEDDDTQVEETTEKKEEEAA